MVLHDLNAAIGQDERTQKRQQDANDSPSHERALELLRLLAENRYVPVARLVARLGKISHKDQAAMVAYLRARKYATFEEPRIGRRNMLLAEVTEAGYGVLSMPVPTGNKGRGSITHRHYAHWICSHFARQGHQPMIEWIVPGTTHPADVAVNVDGCWCAFEITVTASENLTSHLEACFDRSNVVTNLTIITGTAKEAQAVREQLAAAPTYVAHADKVAFDVIEHYL
jgi:hypothetical protein